MDLQEDTRFSEIRVVILAGPLDFGRCPLASRLSPSLWPIGDKPAIVNLVEQLVSTGIKKISICSKSHTYDIDKYLKHINGIDLTIETDILPAGTAGSIRSVVPDGCLDTIVVLPATITVLPDIEYLVKSHIDNRCDMTVFFKSSNGNKLEKTVEIYILNPELLELIPKEGYYDIKESFISDIALKNKVVKAAQFRTDCGQFNNIFSYISSCEQLIKSGNFEKLYPDFKTIKDDKSGFVLAHPSAKIAEDVRFFGVVAVMENAVIDSGSVIIGPVMICKNSVIEKKCRVSKSIIWQDSLIGQQSILDCAVIGYRTKILSFSKINNRPVFCDEFSNCSSLEQLDQKISGKLISKIATKFLPSNPQLAFGVVKIGLSLLAIFGVLFWSYWDTVRDLVQIWIRSDEYSAGLLVPFLALYVLWTRRDKIIGLSVKPSMTGLFALISVGVVRLTAVYFNYGFLERLSFVFSIGCIVLLLFGWRIFFRTFTIFLFLFFMLPLPNRINQAVSLELQEYSTVSAVWLLEVFGYVVGRQGNIINIGQTSVAVAEACNGLRMITAFFVIATWFSLLVDRKKWEKVVVILSALPIAVLCNTLRLSLTALAFTIIDVDKYGALFHDWGGYAMMPLAIGVIGVELWILKNIIIDNNQQNREQMVIVARNN